MTIHRTKVTAHDTNQVKGQTIVPKGRPVVVKGLMTIRQSTVINYNVVHRTDLSSDVETIFLAAASHRIEPTFFSWCLQVTVTTDRCCQACHPPPPQHCS